MSDPHHRTDAEREAARQAREARRRQKTGEMPRVEPAAPRQPPQEQPPARRPAPPAEQSPVQREVPAQQPPVQQPPVQQPPAQQPQAPQAQRVARQPPQPTEPRQQPAPARQQPAQPRQQPAQPRQQPAQPVAQPELSPRVRKLPAAQTRGGMRAAPPKLGLTGGGLSGGELQRRKPKPLPGERRRRPWRWIFLGLFLAAMAFIVWFLISLFQPFTSAEGKAVTVTIPKESSTGDVASLLAKRGVVSSSFFFKLRAELDGDHFTAGTYALALNMSFASALSTLSKGPQGPITTTVTIIPGKSRYQLSQLLKEQGETGDYFKSTLKSTLLDPTRYGAPKNTPSLEGFLYPDTYELRKPISLDALIADQLKQFKKEITKVNFKYAESKNLTPYDVLIIASLEEAEAAKPSDLPKVASVIYNRLRLGMDLGLDTTAAYAANNYTGNLTSAQLKSSSAWNTLNHPGLPPTPINSPDVAAINAAAHPAKTSYTYFIVKVCGNGALNFTNNYQQFLTWSAQYSASLRAKGADKTEFCGTTKSKGSSSSSSNG